MIRCPVCEKQPTSLKEEYAKTLGLEDQIEELTVEEVKRAFREEVKAHHPDKGGSEEKFREIQEAKEELIDMIENPNDILLEEQAARPPTFSEYQNFKHALRNLRAMLKPNKPCPYCKRKY